jgi:hypothetical protein
MAKLTQELLNYATIVNPPSTPYVAPAPAAKYQIYHSQLNKRNPRPTRWNKTEDPIDYANKKLEKFLSASMDEVRLCSADDFAAVILTLEDMEEARYFRQALLRREITGDIDYKSQRDHAAHTVYNYLLGWYIFDHVAEIRNKFKEHLERRFEYIDDVKLANYFGGAWMLSSLLHDIGYIFEGTISNLSTESYNERVHRGAVVVHDYFNHHFWYKMDIDSVEAKKAVTEMIKKYNDPEDEDILWIPDFHVHSLAAVGDLLSAIGPVELLRKKIHRPPPEIQNQYSLSMDAFNIWIAHYKSYRDRAKYPDPNDDPMVDQIMNLQLAYKDLIFYGSSIYSARNLDHGVCGGLLQLLFITFFYRIFNGLPDNLAPADKNDQRKEKTWRIIKGEESLAPEADYSADWWWKIGIWATAATALHNLLEDRDKWSERDDINFRELHIDDDPLTYLGILVDTLEEWDRYFVEPVSVFGSELPLQGQDVDLSTDGTKVLINYNDRRRKEKVSKDLRKVFGNSWEAYICLI